MNIKNIKNKKFNLNFVDDKHCTWKTSHYIYLNINSYDQKQISYNNISLHL